MKNLSIRIKILAVVAVFALGFLGFLGVLWMRTSETLDNSDYARVVEIKDFTADILPPPMYTLEAYAIALELGSVPKTEIAGKLEAVKELEKAFADRKAHWNRQFPAGPLLDAVNGPVAKSAGEVFEIIRRDVTPALEGDRAALPAAIGKLRTAYASHRAAIDDVVRQADTETRSRVDEAATSIHLSKVELLVFGLALTAVSALIGFLIARAISRRLVNVVDLLARVAEGDFRGRMEDSGGKDEVARMGRGLNTALDSIDHAFQEVREAAGQLDSAARVLAASSEQISAGAQQQAASLEETAASLEEITATVKQSAGNAQQASQLASHSREIAENGGQVANDAVRAMQEVSQASRRIGDIITTIDEIALQTNLLALNAAVEAARAGEQGRGFAVVAAEVGNLAQRSAASAKEVKALIEDTLARVEASNSLVGQSGRALGEIITSVKKVTDIFGEIAAAAREQSAGVDQVNEAVAQMDRVTQANTGETNELSKTAERLSRQATLLGDLLERFELSGHRAETPKHPAHEPPTSRRRPSRRGTNDDGRDRDANLHAGLSGTRSAAEERFDDERFEVV